MLNANLGSTLAAKGTFHYQRRTVELLFPGKAAVMADPLTRDRRDECDHTGMEK